VTPALNRTIEYESRAHVKRIEDHFPPDRSLVTASATPEISMLFAETHARFPPASRNSGFPPCIIYARMQIRMLAL